MGFPKKISQNWKKTVPFVEVIVVKRAYQLLGAFFIVRTRLHLENQGMVIQFLPTMTFIAINLFWAAFTVIIEKDISFPMLTYLRSIIVDVWHPSEILPIVGVWTLFLVVFDLVIWTGDSFEIKNVEVSVTYHVVEEVDLNFLLIVGEGAEITVTTFREVRGVVLAKFGLVILLLVELLHFVMGHQTFVTIGTLVVLFDIGTDLIRVEVTRALPILLVMVERTLLVVVLEFDATFVELEIG